MNLKIQTLLKWTRRSGLLSMALMLLALFSVRSSLADWNDVPTGSMKPTILVGDRIFVNKLAYDLKIPFTQIRVASWDDPDRGDIVTCWSPTDGKRLVKRVVAVPGDTIEMRSGQLAINGRVLDYGPADTAAFSAVLGQEAASMRFFTEDLTGAQHAVAYDQASGNFRNFGPVTVPTDKYFMMGDNRDNSADSRYFGFVDRAAVTGQATAVAVSLDYDNQCRPRWSRFFSKLI